jgi:proline utilization trans-activator
VAATLPTSDSHETSLTNPLTTGQSTFMSADDGMTLYLGTSSDWSFTQKILSMVYERVCNGPMPPNGRVFEGQTYNLGWDGKPAQSPVPPALPDIDHAVHLIDTVKFYCGQIFHLFDHDTFMSALHAFYELPSGAAVADELWYIHFLLVLAFGKAFKNRRRQGKCPAGAEFFVNALQRLPNMIMLWRHPLQSVEILVCIALYFQCIDYRITAYNYVGSQVEFKKVSSGSF